MSKNLKCLAVVLSVACFCNTSHGQVRLLGITGLKGDADQVSFPDNTLFEISVDDASTTQLMELTFIPDTHAIGYNPDDGLLYHTAGSESWTDDPGRVGGFRDHQYLETVNLETGELTPIYNANPPESPDEFPSFGPAAPLPTFIAPQQIRLLDDPECEDEAVPGICPRERGENEFHGIRGLTWSDEEKLFYGSDEHGFFKLTPEGESTFIGQPLEDSRNMKGVTWYTKSDGEKVLLAGTKRNANLWTIDPATGDQIGDPVEVQVPPESDFDFQVDGVLALAQHPTTGVLYGVRRTDPEAGESSFERELITIDPETGETHMIGELGLHFASLTFVAPGCEVGDFDCNGVLDATDADLLVAEVAGGNNDPAFDLNGDSVVNEADINVWVKDLANTWFGDANVDGEFNSADLVNVFQAGKYDLDQDAVWSEGDGTGNLRFDSGDLVKAFQDGGYELGPAPPLAAAVPEPSSAVLLMIGLLLGGANLIRRRIK